MMSYPRRQFMLRIAALLGTVGLIGCADGADLPRLPPESAPGYRLGTGDQIRVIVFDQKQLSADYLIGDSGSVDIPLLGPVVAAGRTTNKLADAIAAGLSRGGFLRDPKVAIEVKSYRPFSILGEVAKPGQYQFQPRMTVLTAVSIAGGFTYRAIESRVEIIRVGAGGARKYRAGPAALIAPGDVIKVMERHF